MNQNKKNLKVPSFQQYSKDKEVSFIKDLDCALKKNENIEIDFQSNVYVSSMVLGSIMYKLKDNKEKIKFTNLSRTLYNELNTIMGKKIENFFSETPKDNDIEYYSANNIKEKQDLENKKKNR